MSKSLYEMVESGPVIAAIKDEEGLEKCCELEEIRVVFILYGDILKIEEIVKRVKEKGKVAIVHVDLLSGLASREIAVDFIKRNTMADGIISTKPALIRRAREIGLYTVMRFFLLDSMAFDSIEKQLSQVSPDFVEVLPGAMPKVIKKLCESHKTPIIAGGLISDKEDIMNALNAGAMAVSSTNAKVWGM